MISRRLLRIKILKEVYSFLNAQNTSHEAANKTLTYSIRKTYDLYHLLMQLVVDVNDYAVQQMELGKQKNFPTEQERNPNTKFADNKFIALVRSNTPLRRYCEKQRLTWGGNPEVVKKLLASLYAADFFRHYMAAPSRAFEADKQLVIQLYSELLEDFEPLLLALEDQNIYWIDDVEFALSQIIKTFRLFRQGQSSETPLAPLYAHKGEELFAERVLTRAIINSAAYRELIDRHTKNWEVERVAFMDVVIMITAVAEMMEFPDIPIKVSLNEYIEIAKYYSTPNSSLFINGVLDRVVDELRQEKTLVKQDEQDEKLAHK
ncbi:MAG: transcription antitermination factor NusB [Prevotellaceae bacterium]|jgi:N utilization substance protein B|nr:transcription antitermination factor NusB [Prevotellaceae bacterium]